MSDDYHHDGECPECLPKSQCLACEDDDRGHFERDMRLELDE